MKKAAIRTAVTLAMMGAALARFAIATAGQWPENYPQAPLPAAYDGSLRDAYPDVDWLLNALEYGEARLFGALYEGVPATEVETTQFALIARDLRSNPPKLRPYSAVADPAWSRVAPEVSAMLDWAHGLQRQIYDVLADARLSEEQKDASIAELVAYYKTRPDLAVSSVPKSFDLPDGQYFSLTFREQFPRSNGLAWAAHWLRLGLYESLSTGTDVERRPKVEATVRRFWELLADAPQTSPYLLPVSTAVAPTFSARHPEAAIIADNVGMLVETVSDILASSEIPRELEGDEIKRIGALFRSDTADAVRFDAWLAMGPMIGAENMGGVAGVVGSPLPLPTAPRGISLVAVGTGLLGTTTHAAAPTSMGSMDHGTMGGAAPTDGAQRMQDPSHENMAMPTPRDQTETAANTQQTRMEELMAMHERMLADPVIRERIATDPVLVRMMAGGMAGMIGMEVMGGMAGMQGMATASNGSGQTGAMQHQSLGASETLTAAERQRGLDFIVRLLSDPLVGARLRADPAMAALWADPEVQKRLAELRSPGSTGSPESRNR